MTDLTVNSIATDDTHLDEAAPTTNYAIANVDISDRPSNTDRIGYLNFKLPSIPEVGATITKLELYLHVNTIAGTPLDKAIRVRRGKHDTFDETHPTWDNLNENDAIGWDVSPGDPDIAKNYYFGENGIIGLFDPTGTGWLAVDITALKDVDSIGWDDELTLVLKYDTEHTNNWKVSCHSSEDGGFEPYIKITYSQAGGIPMPTGLTATTTDSTEIRVEWNEPDTAELDNVEVWRAATKYGSYTKQSDTIAGTEYYDDTGLVTQGNVHDYDPQQDTYPNGRTYWYKVRAEDGDTNFSDYTEPVQATTSKPIQPVKVGIVTAIYEDSKYKLQFDWDWAVDSTPEADFLKWEVRYQEEDNTTPVIGSTISDTLEEYDIKSHKFDKAGAGCKLFTYYKFLVVAYDVGGLYRLNADELYLQQIPEGTTLCPPNLAVVPISSTTFDSGLVTEFDMRQSSEADSDKPSLDLDLWIPPDEDYWIADSNLPVVDDDAWKFILNSGAKMPAQSDIYPNIGEYLGGFLMHFKMKYIAYVTTHEFNFELMWSDGANRYEARFKRNANGKLNINAILIKAGGSHPDSQEYTVDEGYYDYWIKVIEGEVRIYKDNLFNMVSGVDDIWGAKLYTGTKAIVCEGADDQVWLRDLQIYGLIKNVDPSQAQGFKIIFGDRTDSGWTSAEVLNHIYNCEPDNASDAFTYVAEANDEDDLPSSQEPTQALTVNNVAPVAHLIIPTVIIKDEVITGNGQLSYDQEGDIDKWEWTWETAVSEETSTPTKTHTYTTTGEKTARLRVKDLAGNWSDYDDVTVYVYDSGDIGTALTLLCPLHDIKQITGDSLSTLDYPELDYDGIQAMGGKNLKLQLTGEHHDPDESHDDGTREANMINEKNAWSNAARDGILVTYTFPQWGALTGYLKNYNAGLDDSDYYRLPFSVEFWVVTEAQIKEP